MAILRDLSKPAPAPRPALMMKVSDKGGISIYGLQRFPVTLYAEQWEAILAGSDELRAFIDANRSALKQKGEV